MLGAWGLGWEVWLNGMEITQARCRRYTAPSHATSVLSILLCCNALLAEPFSCLALHISCLATAGMGIGASSWVTPTRCACVQFTYFQQAGGRPLAVPAVEITYGLERILMSLQVRSQIVQSDCTLCATQFTACLRARLFTDYGCNERSIMQMRLCRPCIILRAGVSCACAPAQGVAHFKDIRYTDNITYGEMFMQNEYEMGRYNLDEADVATQRMRFELYEQVQPCALLRERIIPINSSFRAVKLKAHMWIQVLICPCEALCGSCSEALQAS